MSFNYDLYDNKSKESLIKEFKRTQNEIRKCVLHPNPQMYNMLFLYREEIRRMIKQQEKREDAKEKIRNKSIRVDNDDTNNSNSNRKYDKGIRNAKGNNRTKRGKS